MRQRKEHTFLSKFNQHKPTLETVNFIRAKGLNHRQFQSFFVQEIDSEFVDMAYHPEVLWRSRGKVLSILIKLIEEICQFMDSKGKYSAVVRDKKWKCELAFLSDITRISTT